MIKASTLKVPLSDVRFWTVQILVGVAGAVHYAVELLHPAPHPQSLYFAPEILIMLPIGYAALRFELAGAILTAAWCTLISVPSLLFYHGSEQALGVAIQLAAVNIFAVFVGHRASEEARAMRQRDAAIRALLASEHQYRSLFEASADPVLVTNREGTLLDANPAAEGLFGISVDLLRQRSLTQVLPAEPARQVLSLLDPGTKPRSVNLSHQTPDGTRASIEATGVSVAGPHNEELLQISFRDVTRQRQRQLELEEFAAYTLRGHEEERRRIAHELHDDTLQGLFLLCRHLDTVELEGAPLSVRARETLAIARKSAEGLVDSLRNITSNLRPPVLDNLGVTAAIRRLLTEVELRTGIHWTLRVYGSSRRLQPDAELGLYRIAQEAIRNVEWHSKAKNGHVEVIFEPELVELVVEDDGVGFTVPRRPGSMAGSLGLTGMQERAGLLGGTLDIRTAPGQGTRIRVRVRG